MMKTIKTHSGLMLGLVLALGSATGALGSDESQLPVPSERAMDLAQNSIIVDGHVDFPMQLMQKGIDPISNNGATNFDYERAIRAGFNAPFMSIYVSAHYEGTGGAKAIADMLIGLMEGIANQHPDKFTIATSVRDVRKAAKAGKISFALGMENGSPLEGDLENLHHFYDRGVRYITLAHSKANHISDSSYDADKRWGGLSPFGRVLVREMNDIGVIVDVSHISDDAFYDVIELSKAPIIASHSGARHFTPGFERNMTDEMIKRLAEKDGVIMINFGTHFLTKDGSGRRLGRDQAYVDYRAERGLNDTAAVYSEFRRWFDLNVAVPFASVSDVVDHIDYVRDLVGIDHVGLGSDFDGVGDTLPTGLKDVSGLPLLIQEMIDRGYSDEEIRKVLGENALRVWSAVEDVAKKN
ncbi:dipeptidase [Hyphococcus sp. DH-69]|uniref:dipeptidase n=1 Tax=Hyphococcus formosus TaxID=3143534 RepID=UPI00398AB0DA